MIKRIMVWLGLREDVTGEKMVSQTQVSQEIQQKTTYVECKTCGVLVALGKAEEHSYIVNIPKVTDVSLFFEVKSIYEKQIVTDYFCTRCKKKVGKKHDPGVAK